MAVKGQNAKTLLIQKLKDAYGDKFIGEVDKKVYVWETDGDGQDVQLAISISCPKNLINIDAAQSSEITQEELNKVAEMLSKI